MVKKQLIMEKSLELFAKQGFEATTVQQITEYCGISKGAFYLSFKSKDELIIALIDHFMMQFTADIDHIVRNTDNEENLLYDFYYSMFNKFYKHTDFAKLFIKEQMQSVNEELILKMHNYNRLNDKSILFMIERLYGDKVRQTKYDLLYCIKAFMNAYSELFFFYNVPLNLELLAQSLVEKTNVLVKHTTLPFVTEELIEILKEESLEKESLQLLKQELVEPVFPPAIIEGLLENIRRHPHCKWVSYLLRSYFGVRPPLR
jgi:AcrR family transcriptional regulator